MCHPSEKRGFRGLVGMPAPAVFLYYVRRDHMPYTAAVRFLRAVHRQYALTGVVRLLWRLMEIFSLLTKAGGGA